MPKSRWSVSEGVCPFLYPLVSNERDSFVQTLCPIACYHQVVIFYCCDQAERLPSHSLCSAGPIEMMMMMVIAGCFRGGQWEANAEWETGSMKVVKPSQRSIDREMCSTFSCSSSCGVFCNCLSSLFLYVRVTIVEHLPYS